MKTMLEYLSQYAFYHQNRRNVATHFIGIPMIVVAIAILLSRPHFAISNIELTPAILISIASGLFYLKLDLVIGLIMSALACFLYLGRRVYRSAQHTNMACKRCSIIHYRLGISIYRSLF